jgi:hypothetical protein
LSIVVSECDARAVCTFWDIAHIVALFRSQGAFSTVRIVARLQSGSFYEMWITMAI